MLRKYVGLIGVVLLGLFGVGCDATRHLTGDQYLLKYPIQVKTTGKLKPEVLQSSISLKPNRRILLPKSYLHLHNFGRVLQKDSSQIKNKLLSYQPFNRFYTQSTQWLVNEIGEKPILITQDAIRQDSINLRNTAFANGYFSPDIQYSIDTIQTYWERQKANISFDVQENAPSMLAKVHYRIRDTSKKVSVQEWNEFLAAYDTSSSLLSLAQGPKIYRHKLFEQERVRANNALRNSGYFSFSQNLIEFFVDTAMVMKDSSWQGRKPLGVGVEFLEIPPKFKIGHLQVNIRGAKDPPNVLEAYPVVYRGATLSAEQRESLGIPKSKLSDSVKISFRCPTGLIDDINFNFLNRRIFVEEGKLFRQEQARLTQQRLLELSMVQLASINYQVREEDKELDVVIDIQTTLKYQLKVGAETFTDFDFRTSTNLPVIGASLGISNKNTFGHSELLEVNLGGNFGLYGSQEDESNFQNIFLELGGSIKLNLPRFLLPIGSRTNFALERFNPQTLIGLSLSQENRREFDRLVTGFDIAYRWHHIRPNPDKLITSTFTPLAVNFIDITVNSPEFQQQIDTLPPALRNDYQPRFSSRINYTFTHSTYGQRQRRVGNFFQGMLELGGNLPYLLDQYVLSDDQQGDNRFRNNLFYGQYFKGSFEYKRKVPLGPGRELVFRTFIGAAKAFNTNEDTLQQVYLHVPYENRFFSGGANSMRGWRSNTLGPGRLSLTEFQNIQDTRSASSLLAPGGEIIFEANAEYRFDVYSYLEMALFTDVGNVWFNQEVQVAGDSPTNNPKSVLTKDNLVLGWDVGIGFRFDFSFLILRLDIGQQLFAPDIGWVLEQFPNDIGGARSQYNLGISYPF